MTLTEKDLERYDRQIRLPSFGAEGQLRLKNARVFLVGAGGLGSPASLYLAAAGVGTLGLIDDDHVSVTNLQRQILFEDQQTGTPKATASATRLRALNPSISVKAFNERLTAERAEALFANFDLVVDGTDNFASRSLISRACRKLGKTHVYAGISGFEGQVALFEPSHRPCYRCLFPTLPSAGEVPNCNESGVIGALAGVIGSLQALEAIKHIAQVPGRNPPGTLTVFDGLSLSMRSLAVSPRPDCPHCGAQAHLVRDESEAPEWRPGETLPTGAVWLDVRTADEIAERPLHGARHLPVGELAERWRELCPQTNYVVCCLSGQRSRRAQEWLRERGFRGVWNLRGGLSETGLREIPQ